MPSRRDALKVGMSTIALATLPKIASGQELVQENINCTLQRIACILHRENLVQKTEFRPVRCPTKGVIQYRWSHYYPFADQHNMLDSIEATNQQLLAVMQRIRSIPGAGLDALMHEGLIKGREQEMIEWSQEIHRELIRNMFERPIPFSFRGAAPSEKTVSREMANEKNLERKTTYVEMLDDVNSISMRISPLARLGAGYFMWREGVSLEAAEDPYIDEKSYNAFYGDSKEEFQKWVIDAREEQFAKFIRESHRPITHFLIGAMHDLTNDLNTTTKERISHLNITVQGVLDSEKRNAELIAKEESNDNKFSHRPF